MNRTDYQYQSGHLRRLLKKLPNDENFACGPFASVYDQRNHMHYLWNNLIGNVMATVKWHEDRVVMRYRPVSGWRGVLEHHFEQNVLATLLSLPSDNLGRRRGWVRSEAAIHILNEQSRIAREIEEAKNKDFLAQLERGGLKPAPASLARILSSFPLVESGDTISVPELPIQSMVGTSLTARLPEITMTQYRTERVELIDRMETIWTATNIETGERYLLDQLTQEEAVNQVGQGESLRSRMQQVIDQMYDNSLADEQRREELVQRQIDIAEARSVYGQHMLDNDVDLTW